MVVHAEEAADQAGLRETTEALVAGIHLWIVAPAVAVAVVDTAALAPAVAAIAAAAVAVAVAIALAAAVDHPWTRRSPQVASATTAAASARVAPAKRATRVTTAAAAAADARSAAAATGVATTTTTATDSQAGAHQPEPSRRYHHGGLRREMSPWARCASATSHDSSQLLRVATFSDYDGFGPNDSASRGSKARPIRMSMLIRWRADSIIGGTPEHQEQAGAQCPTRRNPLSSSTSRS